MTNGNSREIGRKQGFTLVEATTAVTLTVLVLGIAIGGFMFALKNTNENDVQSELDIDVQLTMERLKRDLRLSSLDEIFYYPVGPGPYTALSFPMAEDSDGDGLFELDADGKIIWDKTLVYHIWPSSPNELRVTTFTNRDNTLTDAQRQAQLISVVANGGGSGTYNGANASTHKIFENLLDWKIMPKRGVFDAYSPSTERETASLGFALLGNGSHTFQFKVAGKNKLSSGYKIGLDQLTVSPSYGAREAEAQLPVTAQSGASATIQYVPGGSWKGNHHLYFPASAVGNSFTLTMENDRWEETNFGADGYAAFNTGVVFDETLSPRDFVVQLQGNDVAWTAAQQTDSLPSSIANSAMFQNELVYVHLNGAELLTNGNWIAYNGRKCKLTFQAAPNGNLQIAEASIGVTPSTENAIFGAGTYQAVRFSGSLTSPTINAGTTATSDWVDLEINKTNNYVVAYRIANNSGNCFPAAWLNNRTSNPDDSKLDTAGIKTNCIYGLSALTVTYPEDGTYTSQIYDTRLNSPIYGDISWNAVIPAGTLLSTKVRTGDQPDLSDASDWAAISVASSSQSIGASYKRYIQFQTQMQSSSDGLSTPKLKDVTIDWTGEMQLVNISGTLTKGPDYGIVEVLVNGVPLQSAMSVDLMIYKDIFNINKVTKRVTSSLVTDIRPRNTGK